MLKVFIYLTLSISLISCHSTDNHLPEPEINLPEIYSKVENGDFIVKRGKGIISNLIVKKMKEKIPLSHCGIIVFENDTPYIIHSVARELSGKDGVQVISFEDFLNDSHIGSVFISRIKKDKSTEISKFAKELLEKKIPFDYSYDHCNKDEIYCSELVQEVIIKSQKVDLFKQKIINGNNVLTFNSLLDTTFFLTFLIK
jgi:hypothetical protein